MTTIPNMTLRNAELPELVDLLRQQADVKYDVVVPAGRLSYRDGNLVVEGGALSFDDDGVNEADAVLRPTDICEEGISEKLGIPRAYLRTMRTSSRTVKLPDLRDVEGYPAEELLLDANVNGWLQADPNRKFLLRGFRVDDPDSVGIARAFLSDKFAPIDNYDVLLAALAGVQAAGVDVDITGANLSERNMRVSVSCPQVTAYAPLWLANYRSPFGEGGIERARERATYHPPEGRSGGLGDVGGKKIVHAGFDIRNSETGGGAFSIVPRIVVLVCRNGLTVGRDAIRSVHVGGRLEEGVIRWSAETQRKSVDLVKAKVTDAIATFLSPEFVARVVAEVEQTSSTPVLDPKGTLEHVAKTHAFTEDEANTVLAAFIRSGDLTAGGVMQAVTATAQVVEDPDRAMQLEDLALDVLHTASRAA